MKNDALLVWLDNQIAQLENLRNKILDSMSAKKDLTEEVDSNG